MFAKVSVLLAVIATIAASPAHQGVSLGRDGSYQFFYDGGSHSREERRGSDGVVVGKYTYTDPTGEHRVVNYRAGDFGYVAKGDVGVPGAPQAQFPVEVPKVASSDEDKDKDNKQPNQDEERKQQGGSDPYDEDYIEDDVQAIKLQDPNYDGPPDGFPLGFFDSNFQSLRRLPEPTKEEEEQTSTTMKVKDEQSSTTESTKPEDPASHHSLNHFRNMFPFTSFEHHPGPEILPYVSSFHQPAHVHSYRSPGGAHGYYYYY